MRISTYLEIDLDLIHQKLIEWDIVKKIDITIRKLEIAKDESHKIKYTKQLERLKEKYL